jgi:quinol monooxygenase YgiN
MSTHPPAVVLTVRLAADREDVRLALAALVAPVAAQPGCQRCALTLDASDSGRVTLVEEWSTREDLDRHLRSDEFWRVLVMAELCATPPQISIDTVVRREGLEAVARSRAEAGPGQSATDNSGTGEEPCGGNQCT